MLRLKSLRKELAAPWRALRRAALTCSLAPLPAAGVAGTPRVLVLGIYLANRRHSADHIIATLVRSERCRVEQRWIALNGDPATSAERAATVGRRDGFVPKFQLLNELLAAVDWRDFDYVLVADDDVFMPRNFLDAFIAHQQAFDLALAQPARTRTSFADHKFVRQRPGIAGRRTRFVEIGPVFSMRRAAAALLLPFDESSPMGWGYDFVWPVIAERAGLRLGIVDAVPVDHSLRDQAAAYDKMSAADALRAYLAAHEHLTKRDAFTILETFR